MCIPNILIKSPNSRSNILQDSNCDGHGSKISHGLFSQQKCVLAQCEELHKYCPSTCHKYCPPQILKFSFPSSSVFWHNARLHKYALRPSTNQHDVKQLPAEGYDTQEVQVFFANWSTYFFRKGNFSSLVTEYQRGFSLCINIKCQQVIICKR